MLRARQPRHQRPARAFFASRFLSSLDTPVVKSIVRVLAVALAVIPLAATQPPSQSTEFARFVDRYLDEFAMRHPSIAAGNGIHDHDDRLDDFSASGIAAEISALKRDAAQLRGFDSKRLTPDERADQRILLGIIDGWLLEQETLKNW